jgi:putative effector of murein hydrolase LrgA (UPF0299 family)
MRKGPGRTGLIAVLVAFIVILWGGYGHHWPWTGISGRTATLWDWLHLLLLPVACGVLPVLLSSEGRLRRRHSMLIAVGGSALAFVVVAGYVVPWSWTGFVGNRLWDWLNLLALPVAVAVIPVMSELRMRWDSRHSAVALASLAVFIGIVIGGYVGNWSWTGFRGNTLWDWLHLLLLPLLLPTLVVPALRPVASSRMLVVRETEPASPEPQSGRR